MKKFGFAFLLCSVGLFAEEWTGVVSDSHCGKAHSEASAAAAKCVEACIKKGSDPVLVSGDQVMKIDAGSKDKLAGFYGKQVTVTGTKEGDTIKIDSVKGD